MVRLFTMNRSSVGWNVQFTLVLATRFVCFVKIAYPIPDGHKKDGQSKSVKEH